MKKLWLPALATLVVGCATTSGPPPDQYQKTLTLRHFFIYACQFEYMRTHDIPRFDSSYELAAQTVPATASQLTDLGRLAKEKALRLAPPNYADAEHGAQAVLASCQVESYEPHIDALIKGAAQ